MEFVTKPQIESPKQARRTVESLVRLLDYMEVIDRTDSSAVRVDANISLQGDDTTTARAEVKNIGSPSEIEKALSYEISRQKDMVRRDKEQVETTRHWDDTRGITQKLRDKEQAEDYRYMKEYDIPEIRTFSD
jgi:aspartyl-tRNA(Asn)/glutamyl-tRNA(Gln) amidotransferase subunit B